MARSHTMNPGSRNTRQSGVPQGSPGGQTRAAAAKQVRAAATVSGPTMYLWILVAIEVALMGWLRHSFRRYHGG